VLREELASELVIVMRVYFEKPRTTVGWKGFINDPRLDGSFRMNEGLRKARRLLLDLTALGLPAGTEFLDLLSPQYISDLVSWGAIGARTTESQSHRQLASGLSCPVGFKNGTDGGVKVAADAVVAAAAPHAFMGMTKMGQAAIFETRGNTDCHVILRGGKKPNYSAEDVEAACAARKSGLREQVMIDFSHANSEKQHRRQIDVAANVAGQIEAGEQRITGVMIESHLEEGRQGPGQAGQARRVDHRRLPGLDRHRAAAAPAGRGGGTPRPRRASLQDSVVLQCRVGVHEQRGAKAPATAGVSPSMAQRVSFSPAWAGEQEALHLVAVQRQQRVALALGLHPFGHHPQVQGMGHLHDGGDDRAGVGAVLDVGEQAAVHLQLLDRQLAQQREAAVCRSRRSTGPRPGWPGRRSCAPPHRPSAPIR
jgi:phospho-2-dehydro-3-deoxyheptonate aldolase